jgi:hypothetical protein
VSAPGLRQPPQLVFRLPMRLSPSSGARALDPEHRDDGDDGSRRGWLPAPREYCGASPLRLRCPTSPWVAGLRS